MERAAGKFVLGSRVTVCADEDGLRVLRFGTVKRIGNEGTSWRLGGTGEWYDAATGRRIGFDNPHYARPYKDGDELLLQAEQARLQETKRLQHSVALAAGRVSSTNWSRVQVERALNSARVDVAQAERVLARAKHEVDGYVQRLPGLIEEETKAQAALRLAEKELRDHER